MHTRTLQDSILEVLPQFGETVVVDDLVSRLGNETKKYEVIHILRALAEKDQIGQFLVGRRGSHSRFIKKEPAYSNYLSRLPERLNLQQSMPSHAVPGPSIRKLQSYSLPIGASRVNLELPIDLTIDEAEKVAGFVKLLAGGDYK